MQICSIYFRNGITYVISESYTELGIGLSVGPMFKAAAVDPMEVGTIVNSALDASQKGISQPDDLRPLQKSILKFTGARSWTELGRSSMFIAVQRKEGSVVLQKYKHQAGSFFPDGSTVQCTTDSVEDVGRCVFSVLGLVKPLE